MMQTLILAAGFMLVLVLLAIAFIGPNAGKIVSRRLSAVKIRHSDSADARVEQQMRKAVAARRPMIFSDGRSISRTDKLRLRLAQTGKNWTMQQYLSASAGIAAVVMAALWIKGAPFYLALFGGLLLGAGIPHFVIGYLMTKRVKPPSANACTCQSISALPRTCSSGLGVLSVSGRMRWPRPAAKIRAGIVISPQLWLFLAAKRSSSPINSGASSS